MRVFFTISVMIAFSSALADDGLLEINQTCAIQTGCFPGDTAGFPVTIGQTPGLGRSFVLTSDLNTGSGTLVGIQIDQSRITIDLNGFEINGPGIGSENDVGHGIAGGPPAFGATILNGSIRGHRGRGIALSQAKNIRVENLLVERNADGGIEVGPQSIVKGNRVDANGTDGDDGNEMDDQGIFAGPASLISGNIVSQSGASGIICIDDSPGEFFAHCVISNNTTHSSGLNGIRATTSLITNNKVHAATSDGIFAITESTARGNHVSYSGGYGIRGDIHFSYGDNTLVRNLSGGVFGPGSRGNLGGNYCSGANVISESCP